MIPDSYSGYFELLSEEGRAVRCIESVAELARRKPEEGCLVRETIRGVQAKTESDGTVTPEGARTIPAGEILVPTGEAVLQGSKGTLNALGAQKPLLKIVHGSQTTFFHFFIHANIWNTLY